MTQSVDTENRANESAQNTDESTSDSNASSQETAETSSDGVIVNEDGVVVANAYNEGGTLVWPVDGKVILPYSMDTTIYFKTLRSYRCNPGILIAADEGENVLAAYEGVVESVSEDKEHGTTVTVIMGNGFKAIVVLPQGTNTDLMTCHTKSYDDKLLTAKNKWLIAHKEAGIEGVNKDAYTVSEPVYYLNGK